MSKLAVVKTQAKTPLEEDVGDFLSGRKAKGASAKTLAHYRMVLTRVFLPWCEEQSIKEFAGLNQRKLDRFSADLQERGISQNSAHSYLRTVATFFSWAKESGLDGAERVGTVSKPRLGEKVLPVLTRPEMERLEKQAGKKPGDRGRRDSLIVGIFVNTGMRADELCQLRWPQDLVETEDGKRYLHVQGKGNKERLVFIDAQIARRIREYAKKDRPQDTQSDRLFLSFARAPKSRGGEYEPLHPSGILQMVRAVAQDAGIEKRVYTHLLRHSFATDYLNRGGNPVHLRRILGHSSLEMIDRTYANLVNADLAEAMEEYQRRLLVKS